MIPLNLACNTHFSRSVKFKKQEKLWLVNVHSKKYFLTHPIIEYVIYSRRRGKKVLCSFPTPTLVLLCWTLVVLATRVRLGNKYAAFFPFSAGNEYELYDSCVKKLYIALGNIVGCVNLRVCALALLVRQLSRREHTVHFIPLVHNILFFFFGNVKGKFLRNCSYTSVVLFH